MDAKKMFTTHDISRYYDLSEVHYRRMWNLSRSRSLHYGYWDETTKNFHEALLNINNVLAGLAGIKNGDVVLDAGCGVGGSSLWLASQRGCNVTGISLNAKQVEKAAAYSTEAGLSASLKFEQKNYLHTGYPSGSFDVVWAIESVCYADDKSEFMREAFRLLKRGGRLIVADFFKADNLSPNENDAVRRWAAGWAINDYATLEDFQAGLHATGFQEIEVQDASEAILPSAKRLYRSYFIGKPAAMLYRLFNGKVTELSKNNVETAYQQYKTLKQGLWKYGIVKAVKY